VDSFFQPQILPPPTKSGNFHESPLRRPGRFNHTEKATDRNQWLSKNSQDHSSSNYFLIDLLLIDYFFQVTEGRGRSGPPGVKCNVRNRSHKFFLCEAVFKSISKMELNLLVAIQRKQAYDGNQAFTALQQAEEAARSLVA
jgi:hypothetical protein